MIYLDNELDYYWQFVSDDDEYWFNLFEWNDKLSEINPMLWEGFQ